MLNDSLMTEILNRDRPLVDPKSIPSSWQNLHSIHNQTGKSKKLSFSSISIVHNRLGTLAKFSHFFSLSVLYFFVPFISL